MRVLRSGRERGRGRGTRRVPSGRVCAGRAPPRPHTRCGCVIMCAPAAGQTAQRAAAERGGALPSYTAGSFVPRPTGSRHTSSGEHDQLRQVCRARGPPLVPRHLYGIAQHAGGIVKRLRQPTLHWATQTDGCVHQSCRGPAATAAGGTQADSDCSCDYQGGWGQSQH